MKKVLILLVAAMFLAACGGNDVLGEFTQEFNERADSDGIDELNSDEFGKIEVEDDKGWQQLYESDKYYIDAKYDEDENLSGYYLVIDENEPFEEYEGEGYQASITTSKALKLSAGDFANGFGTAVREGSHTYVENGYRISFTYPGESGLTSVGMIINYDKK